jgi:hypothetical protein
MMGLITKLIASSLGRWALGIGVTALLSGLAYKWYDFKRDLRDEGVQECVQEINIATVDQPGCGCSCEPRSDCAKDKTGSRPENNRSTNKSTEED